MYRINITMTNENGGLVYTKTVTIGDYQDARQTYIAASAEAERTKHIIDVANERKALGKEACPACHCLKSGHWPGGCEGLGGNCPCMLRY